MTETHRIEGTDRLLMQTIRDQAADLEHGWREAIQNGIDSPGATRVELNYDHKRTWVRDNGPGVDLDSDKGLALLKNLGETSKADDPDTIGQFGVGKGQIIAKGHAVFMSGDTALHFDVNEWGLECKTVPLPSPVDGLVVRVAHYSDEVPSSGSYKWSRFEDRVKSRFKFVEEAADVEVVINGERISDADPASEVSGEHSFVGGGDIGVDFVAAFQPSATGDIDVYSRGVYVKSVEGHGTKGVVVTRENLDLNFARNDIKSGCAKWQAVSAWLDDKISEVLAEVPDSRLTSEARGFLAERSLSKDGNLDPEAPMFRTVSGDNLSLNDLQSASQISFAPGSDHRAKKLADGWSMTILDTDDDATERLQRFKEDLEETMSMPDEFDVDEKADEVSLPDSHEELGERDLNTVQRRKLAAARELADRMGISRRVKWGDSEVSDAWTDGRDTIVLTDEAAPERNRAEWLPNVFRALVHQWSHREDTEGGCDDDDFSFNRRYRERMEEQWSTFTQFAGEAERDGLTSAVRPAHAALTA